MPRQVSSYDHLYPKRFAETADRDIGCGSIQQPVRAEVTRGFEHVCRNLVQHLSLVGDGAG